MNPFEELLPEDPVAGGGPADSPATSGSRSRTRSGSFDRGTHRWVPIREPSCETCGGPEGILRFLELHVEDLIARYGPFVPPALRRELEVLAAAMAEQAEVHEAKVIQLVFDPPPARARKAA